MELLWVENKKLDHGFLVSYFCWNESPGVHLFVEHPNQPLITPKHGSFWFAILFPIAFLFPWWPFWIPRKTVSEEILDLVGGFNPFEKNARQIGSFPRGWGWKWKNIWNHHPNLLQKLSFQSMVMDLFDLRKRDTSTFRLDDGLPREDPLVMGGTPIY